MNRAVSNWRIKTIGAMVLGCVLGFNVSARAVTTTAMGQIWDASHNTPCAGAWVWVYNNSNSVYANSQGLYLIENFDLPEFWYLVPCGVTKTGYVDYYKSNQPIQPGTVNTINASVYIGSLISGRVTSHQTGSPALVGATVTANSTAIIKVLTQADGSYSMRVKAGIQRISAEKDGFSGSLTTQLALTDGVDVPNVNFQLYVGGTITGTVYFGDTTATADGMVIQSCPSGLSNPVIFTTTGPGGIYTLEHVYPAPAYVYANAPDHWTGASRDYVPVNDESTTAGIDIRLPPAGDMSGTITAYTGAPIDNVYVKLTKMYSFNSESWSANTGTNGFYEKPNIPEGNYDIYVQPPQGLNLQSAQVGNVGIRQYQPVYRNFTLQPGGRIEGVVRGPDGNPIANAKTKIYLDKLYPFDDLFTCTTDAGGNYYFDGLTPYLNYAITVDATSVNTYTASAVERGLAIVEQITHTLNFDLPIGGGISGMLQDESNQPVSGAVIAVFMNDAQSLARFCYNGVFTFNGLPQGNYFSVFFPNPNSPINFQAESSVIHVTAGQTDTLNFTMDTGGTCSGYVYYRELSGNTIPAANLQIQMKSAQHEMASLNVRLSSQTETDGGGRYELMGLSAMTYDLQAVPPVEETTGWACANARVAAAAGAAASQNIYLYPNGQKVYGLVRDQVGNRLSNCMVAIWTAGGFRAFAQTDDNGNYAIMLAPGTYYLQGCYTSLEGSNFAMNPVEGAQVTAGQNKQQDIVLSMGGRVSGRITDQLGNPVALAKVWAYTANDLLPYRYGFTNQTGKYTIRGLHSSPYTLEAECPGYSRGSGGFAAALGEETEDVNLVLVAQTSIAGRIAAKNGKPLCPATASVLEMSSDRVLAQTATNPDGEFILSPVTGGPYRVKAAAAGMKSQVLSGKYAGERADFTLEPLISRDEAISYPNPCRGKQLTFLCWLEQDSTVLIRVYNQNAALVWDWEGRGAGQTYNQHVWDVSGVAPGVYLFKITARDDGGNTTAFPTGKLTVIK